MPAATSNARTPATKDDKEALRPGQPERETTLQDEYGLHDILFKELIRKFVEKFIVYLSTVRSLRSTTVFQLRTIARHAGLSLEPSSHTA